MKIAIALYDEVDLLDAGGPYEVFLTASRLAVRDGSPPPFEVVTVSPNGDAVTAYGGLRLVPNVAPTELDDVDVVVIPGTVDIDRVLENADVITWLRNITDRASLKTSVCTGAFVLNELGLLDGHEWTTHWEDVELLQSRNSRSGHSWVKWVDGGDVVTSGGLSSGIAMALHLVDRLVSRDLAIRTAKQLEYRWDPDEGIIQAATSA